MSEGTAKAVRTPRSELLLLLFLVLGTLAWFADKAFTIDDPLFLWLGEQLQTHPLDPFGFSVNWNASQLPMHTMSQNPPLTGYWIAAVASLLGWSELALHLAFLLPAAVATAMTYLLARRFCGAALEASVVALLTPVFLVSATSIMCDASVLAFWCAAVWCWVAGFDRGHAGWLAAGASLAGLAFVTKFSGIALVPLLFAYGLLRERRVGTWCLHLLLPIGMGLAYDRATSALYGVGHVVETLRFAAEFRVSDQGVRLHQAAMGLVFAGGCLIPALFYAPLLWSRRACLLGLALVASCLLLWRSIGPTLGVSLPEAPAETSLALVLQFLLFAGAGASLVGLAIADFWRRRDADSALLGLWLLGILVFASFFNWVTNARSILPMAPAFGILLVRRLEHLQQPFTRGRGLALAAGVIVALWVVGADYRWANDVRSSARELTARHVAPGHETYFLGNWGLQFYLEQSGATAVDDLRWPQRGDRLIVASNNTDGRSPPEAMATLLEVVEGHEPSGMRTVSRGVAGFYASAIGPLPYAWSPGNRDRYYVWKLERPVRFTPSW